MQEPCSHPQSSRVFVGVVLVLELLLDEALDVGVGSGVSVGVG